MRATPRCRLDPGFFCSVAESLRVFFMAKPLELQGLLQGDAGLTDPLVLLAILGLEGERDAYSLGQAIPARRRLWCCPNRLASRPRPNRSTRIRRALMSRRMTSISAGSDSQGSLEMRRDSRRRKIGLGAVLRVVFGRIGDPGLLRLVGLGPQHAMTEGWKIAVRPTGEVLLPINRVRRLSRLTISLRDRYAD